VERAAEAVAFQRAGEVVAFHRADWFVEGLWVSVVVHQDLPVEVLRRIQIRYFR
jgi:hypothetical protein